jgi:hypothetical protein
MNAKQHISTIISLAIILFFCFVFHSCIGESITGNMHIMFCTIFFAIMFTVPIWNNKQQNESHTFFDFEFCTLMQKRMFQGVIIAFCATIIGFLLDCDFFNNGYIGNHYRVRHVISKTIFLTSIVFFCPLFTLYNVKKDVYAKKRIGLGDTTSKSEKTLDFWEAVLIFTSEYLAIILMLIYICCHKKLISECINKQLLGNYTTGTMALGYLSMHVFFTANKPYLSKTFIHQKIFHIFKKTFPHLQIPLVIVVCCQCAWNRQFKDLIVYVWFLLMLVIFFKKVWNNKAIASSIFFGASLIASILALIS